MPARSRLWRLGGAGALGVQHLGVISPGSLHVWEVAGRAWPPLMSGLPPSSPTPSPPFTHSLDLSELAKAAKKKLQAVSAQTGP